MDFSDVYITGGQSFVCLSPTRISSPLWKMPTTLIIRSALRSAPSRLIWPTRTPPDADVIELTKVPDIIAELVTGKLDGAFIETMVAESYATQYPELCSALEVPYDAEGSVVGVSKGQRRSAGRREPRHRRCQGKTAPSISMWSTPWIWLPVTMLTSRTARSSSSNCTAEYPQFLPRETTGRNWLLFSCYPKKRRKPPVFTAAGFKNDIRVHRAFQAGPDLHGVAFRTDCYLRLHPGPDPGHHAAFQRVSLPFPGADL